MASISPSSSASGMNSPGGTSPPFGSSQRTSASADPFCHRLRDLHRRVRAGTIGGNSLQITQQDEELVAPLPGHQVGLARTRAQPVTELREQKVTRVVPQRVVHQLEVVEVEVQHP